ncbi:MAG: proton-conducting transporter membrane subunit [Thermotogota bacterium]
MNLFFIPTLIFFSSSILLYFFYKHKSILIKSTYISGFIILLFSKYGSFVPNNISRNLGIQLSFDYNNKLILLFFFVLSFLTYSIFFRKKEKYFLMIFLILNGAIINFFQSRDYFNIYVSLELISMSLFLLVAYEKKVKMVWASLKYMIFSSIALNLYLISIAILYSNTGSLNIIENLNFEKPLFFQTFLVSSLLIKSGVFFLAGWVIDVQSYSTPGVSSILTGVVEKMGLWMLFLIFPSFNQGTIDFLLIFAISTLFLSYIYLLFQHNIKKIFAISTMSQVSYGLLVIIFSREVFVYFFIYHMITKGLIFIFVDKLFTEKNIITLYDLKRKIIRYDIYLVFFILIFNLTGVYPSILYIIKKNIELGFFLNFVLFLVGIFFEKIMDNIHIKEKYKKINHIIIPSVFILIFINLYFQAIEIKEIIIGFVFLIVGAIIYKIFKDKISFREINIFNFSNNLIYILAFILIIMIFELKGMI